MTYVSPGPISSSVPSSCVTIIRPDSTTPRCLSWQLFPPTIGLMHPDHDQPGSSVKRAAVVLPMCTTSTRDFSGVRVSSGESKSRFSTPAIPTSSVAIADDYDRSRRASTSPGVTRMALTNPYPGLTRLLVRADTVEDMRFLVVAISSLALIVLVVPSHV